MIIYARPRASHRYSPLPANVQSDLAVIERFWDVLQRAATEHPTVALAVEWEGSMVVVGKFRAEKEAA